MFSYSHALKPRNLASELRLILSVQPRRRLIINQVNLDGVHVLDAPRTGQRVIDIRLVADEHVYAVARNALPFVVCEEEPVVNFAGRQPHTVDRGDVEHGPGGITFASTASVRYGISL
jgi:hypothetical protein